MWYSNMYRRHLSDMHIDDWSDEFLSEFSPENYVDNLKRAKVQNAMIYLQSHVGLCYYPTKIGHMHKAFVGKEDMMKRTIDLCYENGIHVTGYYSLNYNTVEHDAHPDWRMVTEEGKSRRDANFVDDNALTFASKKASRYGLLCPNNMEHRQFVYEQITEMYNYFKLDGFFFDMPFWPHTCYCDKCRARWAKEVGGELPTNVRMGNNELFYTLARKKVEWMGEWIQSVTDHVKSLNPELSVEHNYATAIAGNVFSGCGYEVNEASDFVGGDLYGGIINHSVACKFYKNITKNAPFDYMFSRCKPGLRMHTLSKSYDEMKTEIMLTTAHNGATMVIDAIDPKGTLDKRFYDTVGKLFEFEAQYEPYLVGKMREDVGVYYSYNSVVLDRGENCDIKSCVKGIEKAIVAEHIPHGVVGPFCKIEDSKVLLVPSLTDMDKNDFDRIEKYLRDGGKILLSGMESPELTERLLGCRVLGRSEEVNIYLAPTKKYEEAFLDYNSDYPFPYEGTAPLIECGEDSEVMAYITLPYTKPSETRFASIHSNPPGIKTNYPAAVRKKVGKGEIIWLAVNLEAVADIYECGKIYTNLIRLLYNDFSVSSNAPSEFEITVFDADNCTIIHTVHVREEANMPTVAPFEVCLKVKSAPKSIELMPNGEKLDFTYEGGCVKFTTVPTHVYNMYRILY